MKTEREAFEKIERVKDILSEYDWFFDFHSNQYVLESHSGDIGCLQASSYLDGLWYMWQARVPEGYVVVPVDLVDEIEDKIWDNLSANHTITNQEGDGFIPVEDIDLGGIYKAMIESEK